MKVFQIGCLIDGQGGKPQKNVFISVQDGIIKNISKDCPKDVEVIDYQDKVVIPGMINCHTHICMNPFSIAHPETETEIVVNALKNLEALLYSGVTFFRDLGGENGIDLKLRDLVNQGVIKGPHFLASGAVITMTGGHGWQFGGRQCDGEDEVMKATREQLRSGADVIKIMATGGVLTPGVDPGSPQLTEKEMIVSVLEAHKANKKTATHAQGTVGIKNAIRAGIDSVEHGIFLDDEAIQMMIDNEVFLVPTLTAPYWIVEKGEAHGIPKFAVDKSKRIINDHLASFRKAHQAGVKIAMGTDAGTPFNGFDMTAYELILMVEQGMSPMEAIVASTKNAAQALGIDSMYGTLEVGHFADFIVFEQNPLDDIKIMLAPVNVYQHGKKV